MKRQYIRFRSQTGKEKTSFESMSNSQVLPKKKMSNSEEPPQKKREEEAYLIEDVALNCLARVSRLEHAALSVASKSFRSLVASPDLYRIRSLMGRTETCVYVCLLTPPPDQNPRWYILHRRKTLDGLIPIPSLPSQAPEASSVVVLDWGIYVIGGMMKGNKRTSDVWLLDCRTHTWRQVPSMGVARAYAAVGVVDGKIYVLGGCGVYDPKKWGEVFDPKTQTWDALPPRPTRKEGNNNIHDSVVWDQKVYSVDGTNRINYYSPSQGQWGRGNRGQVMMGNRRDWCMIDNLIYFLDVNGFIHWCEPGELEWREPERMDTKEVKGLDSLHWSLFHSRVVHFGEHLLHRWEETNIAYGYTVTPGMKTKLEDLLPGARLSNSGGNIVLFWDVIEGDQLEIWCAEISLERRQGGDIWGNIEWSIPVMIVPSLNRYKLFGNSASFKI